MQMYLTPEETEILNGKKGNVLAKVMKTLVMYGETFGATKMIPVTSTGGHLVTSFGLSVLKPVYKLMDELIEGGAVSLQPFSVDPRPLDSNVPSNLLQKILFNIMYSKQADYETQLVKMGLMEKDAFTCTCYMDEVGNTPKKGDVLSWAESSAVVYANSVLGARCNRNSGILELFGSIVGRVPYFGLLTDEGRQATWTIEIKTTKIPESQLLGSAIGMKVMENVPYIYGLDKWLGTELTENAKCFLKDMGAAAASNGAVGLYHVDGLTPEAVEIGKKLIASNAITYEIDDAELEMVQRGYPCIWKDNDAEPKLCFIGCPHLSLSQLNSWADCLDTGLSSTGRKKVAIPTVFTTAPAVLAEFKKTPAYIKMSEMGAIISSICPLMYMNNPLCGKMPVITCSNKLRTYTSARYYTENEILQKITKGVN